MNDVGVQIIAVAIMFALIGASYWRWVRPHKLGLEAQGLLLLLILTMIGGLLGSTGWWTDNPSAFSWDLPPLASRMLGAAGWAFGAAAFMTLQRPIRQRTQIVLLMLVVYLVPLALTIIAFHLDRFDWSAPITYAFFIIVTGMILPTLWYLFRRLQIVAATAQESTPPTQPTRLWLMLVAVVMGLWGAALFITDSGGIIWVWPGDLLTSRLIAVMLLTIATAALYSLRSASAAQVTLVMMIVYGFGAVLANLLNAAAGKPVQGLYVTTFGVLGIVSLVLYARRSNQLAPAAA